MMLALRLGYRRDAEELESLSKFPHCIRRREEDDKAILYPLLCTPSPLMNPIISGVHADACGPFWMVLSRASLN